MHTLTHGALCELQNTVAYCSVLQCVTVIASSSFGLILSRTNSVLQCGAVCCNMLQYVAVCCCVLQHVAACCCLLRSLLRVPLEEDIFSYTDSQIVCCSMLQCVAVCCSELQCVAVFVAVIVPRGSIFLALHDKATL